MGRSDFRGSELPDSDIAQQLAELRSNVLGAFLIVAAIGYATWHFVGALSGAVDRVIQVYTVAPVAVAALAGASLLHRRRQAIAPWVFVGGAHIAIAWAILVLNDPRPSTLHATVALAAAFVIGPLGGVVAVCAGSGMTLLLMVLRPDLVSLSDVWFVAGIAIFSVTGMWVVTSHVMMVLTWYSESYRRAELQTREARTHRGELVEAKRQLDHALYRLERANAALQLAWKAADEAERSRMELATNISHEFRTPLNLIIGYSEMMLTSPASYGDVPLPPRYRVDLNAVYRSAQHLLGLADDVLDLARMETGSVGLIREPTDLREVIRDAVALVRDYVSAKALDLRLSIEVDVPLLLLDRLRVRQVLLNLLTNAARMTERGFVEVRLIEQRDFVRVEVADTGPGIPPADLPHIFQRLKQREPSGPAEHRGAGLGLPISRRFVELHGGDMGVESVAGRGSTFWFTLPLAQVGGAAITSRDSVRPPSAGRDQPPVLMLSTPDVELAHVLQRHLDGFSVEMARDLADACDRAEEAKAVAILADLDSPPRPPNGKVPLVRCPLPSVKRLAARLGAADYLIKPVSREHLVDAIRQLRRPIERILVVDDVPWYAELLVRMLNAAGNGYQIVTAHNGDEALEKMRLFRPDLLLLDLAMPGLDGPGVLDRMASDATLAGIDVIVISAHAEGEGNVPLGDTVHIHKPEGFRLAELMRVLSASIREMAPVRAHVQPTVPAPPGATID